MGIAAHAGTPIWVGSGSGLFQSLDSGDTWQLVPVSVNNPLLQSSSEPQTTVVFAIGLDPQQPSTVYFVGQLQGSGDPGGFGFFRSIDNGKTWTGTSLTVGIPPPYSILVDPVLTNVIYLAGWNGGVGRSMDYGATWSPATVPILPNSRGNGAATDGLGVDPNTSGVVYMSSGATVYTSHDFATTWSLPTLVAPNGSGPLLGSVVVDPQNSNVLFVGNDIGSGGYGQCMASSALQLCGLFRSSDGGKSWANVAPIGNYNQVVFDSRSSVPYMWGTVVGTGDRILTSANGGNAWTPTSTQPPYSIDYPINLLADPGAGSSLFGYAWGENLWLRSTDGGVTFTSVTLPTTVNQGILTAAVPRTLGNVSAASFESGPVAPESIVSALGFDLAIATFAPAPQPAPTDVGNTTVTVTDSTGVSRLAPLFYVSPSQVNYEIPAGTAAGVATVTVKSGDGAVSKAPLGINAVAPSLFTLNATGLVAADAIEVSNGGETYANVYQLNSSNEVVPLPINLGAEGDQVYLVLAGTGVRGASNVSVTVGGVAVPVIYAGAQSQFAGEDQINVGPLPRSLAGSGSVALALTADGITANSVNVSIQ